MNKKGVDMTLSTIIVIIVAILVLIGLVYFLTGGFKQWSSSTKPFTDNSAATSVKQACDIACTTGDTAAYCKDYSIDSQIIKCNDKRLVPTCTNIAKCP